MSYRGRGSTDRLDRLDRFYYYSFISSLIILTSMQLITHVRH